MIHIPQGERIDGRGDGTCCENATVADADLATRTGLNRRTYMYHVVARQLPQENLDDYTNYETPDGVNSRSQVVLDVRYAD